ncbi:MAG: TIGR00300 family protein [Planctomycetaceae bacterium]|nr:TIGR00300 family protein [Planctomycetaceae bacterium]
METTQRTFNETVELSGHIIDSLLLPKVLDLITECGGTYRIPDIRIGRTRKDSSRALIEVQAESETQLQEILHQISDHGAVSLHTQDCQFVPADLSGAFPEGFYSTTNQHTQVRLDHDWIDVELQEMDCGILVDPAQRQARCIPMTEVRTGDLIVVGHAGVKVVPLDRSVGGPAFEFMSSSVSTEKPKGLIIRQIAQDLFQLRQRQGNVLLVGGPAIVHTGSGKYVCELIRRGYVQHLFAGNALATHDIEQALFETSLGVHLGHGAAVDAGHEHHLRAINTIRRLGGMQAAVDQGVLQSGIMYECLRQGVDVLLAGSIRDDGPLPEVITDTLRAQGEMRRRVPGLDFCLMIATTLHSIATGNLLPASVKVVCVDINPSTVIKLGDRGSFQTLGLVTDVDPFLRALIDELDQLEVQGSTASGPGVD